MYKNLKQLSVLKMSRTFISHNNSAGLLLINRQEKKINKHIIRKHFFNPHELFQIFFNWVKSPIFLFNSKPHYLPEFFESLTVYIATALKKMLKTKISKFYKTSYVWRQINEFISYRKSRGCLIIL